MDVASSQATAELDCGSDHRAVRACIWLLGCLEERPKGTRQIKWQDTPEYVTAVDAAMLETPVRSLHDVHDVVKSAFHVAEDGCMQPSQHNKLKPWDSEHLRALRAARRRTRDMRERRVLSKQISTDTRRALRTWQTQRLRTQLESF